MIHRELTDQHPKGGGLFKYWGGGLLGQLTCSYVCLFSPFPCVVSNCNVLAGFRLQTVYGAGPGARRRRWRRKRRHYDLYLQRVPVPGGLGDRVLQEEVAGRPFRSVPRAELDEKPRDRAASVRALKHRYSAPSFLPLFPPFSSRISCHPHAFRATLTRAGGLALPICTMRIGR